MSFEMFVKSRTSIFNFKSDFAKSILTLISGTTVGQLVTLAAAPVLTRLYTPDQFGYLGIVMSIVAILGVQMSLKYDMAIVVTKFDSDAKILLLISFISAFVLWLLISGLFYLGTYIEIINPKYVPLLGYISVGIFFMGIYQIFYNWFIRKRKFKQLALRVAVVAIITVIVQLFFGFLKLTEEGLIIGYLCGLLVGIAYLVLNSFTITSMSSYLENITVDKIKLLIKSNLKFPTINTPQSLLNAASQHIPTVLLAFFFSPVVVGFYVLGRKFFSIPMSVVQQAFTQVYFQKVSEIKNNDGDLYSFTKSIYKKLFIIGVVPSTLIFFTAPLIFKIVFGNEWKTAGEYLSILIPWLFAGFIVSPSTTLLTIINKQEFDLIFNIILFILRALSIVIGAYYYDSIYVALILYSLVGLLSNVIYSLIILKFSQKFKLSKS